MRNNRKSSAQVLSVCLCLFVVALACSCSGQVRPQATPIPPASATIRGVGLGLFASEADYDYGHLLAEIARLGATDILLVIPWYQKDVTSVEIHERPGFSPSISNVERTIRQAKRLGFRVAVLPIVRLIHRTPTQWRGKISPSAGASAWFSQYSSMVLPLASVCRKAGADRLGIGSELVSLEKYEVEWRALTKSVRQNFRGKLFYSANWDHYREVGFWSVLDEVGVTAYFELSQSLDAPTEEGLVLAWQAPFDDLRSFAKEVGKPVFMSEIGYPSIQSAARFPWDETRVAPLDHKLQAQLYDVFCEQFKKHRPTTGFYFWNWFGFGGPDDSGYTPRGKPAALKLAACLRSLH